jgi:hypothetical protein
VIAERYNGDFAAAMMNPSLPTRALRLLAALALVCAAGWYSPLATAAIWHLLHPVGWVKYRGLQVRVPWPWIADVDADREDPSATPQGLSLKKSPFAVNRRALGQSIFVTVIAQDPGVTAEQQTSEWMKTFRATHPGETFDGNAPVALPSGASCSRAESDAGSKPIVWTCISVSGGWVADYEGYAPDVPVFFDVVARLKR